MKSLSHSSQYGDIAQRFPSTVRLDEPSGIKVALHSRGLSGSPTNSVHCAQIVQMDVMQGRYDTANNPNTAGILSPLFQI
jgi:hypothetical protein